MSMTIIESSLDREALNEIIREAISQTDETDHKNLFTDVINGGRGYTDVVDVVREHEQNKVLLSVAALLMIVAPIAGCVIWFASVSLWINIAILSFAGILGGIVFCISEPRESSENIVVDIVCSIVACVLNALFYILVTAILVAIIEGILWIGAWIF